MTFGFPAYHTSEHPILPDEAGAERDAVRAALQSLSWTFRSENDGEILASTGLNMKSWGERISIRFQGGAIVVTSRCAMPAQCVDWGRNKSNVERFIGALRQRA